MARNFQATERCGCGASITVESYTHSGLREVLQEFREMHVHIEVFNNWGFGAGAGGSGGIGSGSGPADTGEGGGGVFNDAFDSDGLPWAMPDEEE